jgi:hypothetical protein
MNDPNFSANSSNYAIGRAFLRFNIQRPTSKGNARNHFLDLPLIALIFANSLGFCGNFNLNHGGTRRRSRNQSESWFVNGEWWMIASLQTEAQSKGKLPQKAQSARNKETVGAGCIALNRAISKKFWLNLA